MVSRLSITIKQPSNSTVMKGIIRIAAIALTSVAMICLPLTANADRHQGARGGGRPGVAASRGGNHGNHGGKNDRPGKNHDKGYRPGKNDRPGKNHDKGYRPGKNDRPGRPHDNGYHNGHRPGTAPPTAHRTALNPTTSPTMASARAVCPDRTTGPRLPRAGVPHPACLQSEPFSV